MIYINAFINTPRNSAEKYGFNSINGLNMKKSCIGQIQSLKQ
ncbi:hypothetical protein CSB66_1437 [Enterobacter hormaechei]|nr:hypothetical protein CSB66_1437 [Enterobacter hormaechei]